MSSNPTNPTTTTPSQNTTTALKDHLRAFEHAKLERIVRANADTPAGAGIRRHSDAVRGGTSAHGAADDHHTPLVPRKPHWTVEERWESGERESGEEWERRMSVAAAAEAEAAAEVRGGEGKEGGDGGEGEEGGDGKADGRKGSVRSSIGGLFGKTFTGYVGKRDEFGRYPI